MRHGWGVCAVTLGVWEAAAVTTGRLPTVSSTWARFCCRRRTVARLVFVLWAAGLFRHLDRHAG